MNYTQTIKILKNKILLYHIKNQLGIPYILFLSLNYQFKPSVRRRGDRVSRVHIQHYQPP